MTFLSPGAQTGLHWPAPRVLSGPGQVQAATKLPGPEETAQMRAMMVSSLVTALS